jgi:hypothetical protein
MDKKIIKGFAWWIKDDKGYEQSGLVDNGYSWIYIAAYIKNADGEIDDVIFDKQAKDFLEFWSYYGIQCFLKPIIVEV